MSVPSHPLIMSGSFDVFLSHNSKDKPMVRQLAQALKARGLQGWLDEEQLVPGRPWQEALEEIIGTARTAAVLVGKDGLGPWEIPEMRACLAEFKNRHLPVIPVLLPDALTQPKLPLFLQELTWVDLRGGLTEDNLNRLEWGITGVKPGQSLGSAEDNLHPLQVTPIEDVEKMSKSFNNTITIKVGKIKLASESTSVLFVNPFEIELNDEKPSCCVMGSSGSGKTTFFKSLFSRFREEWKNLSSTVDVDIKVSVNGEEIEENIDANIKIGFATQKPYFIPHQNVRENLTAPFKWRGNAIPTDSEVDLITEHFELTRIRERKAYQLSAGERQKVNLARMFLLKPKLAIIDECLTPMDEQLAIRIGKVIVEFYNNPTRILITSHRSSDLSNFKGLRMNLNYEDKGTDKMRTREVKAEVN